MRVTRTVLPGDAVMTTLEGAEPGPTVALLGGVHGDEDEGVLAVRRLLNLLNREELAGRVKAVAPANPVAWDAGTRVSPLDDGNLARSFPGDGSGPTAALASALTSDLIDGADLLIDLHSAGVAYRMPLFCGFVGNVPGAERSRRAAEAFGAPLVWVHPTVGPGRSLTVAAERGIPALYAECSGGGGIRSDELDFYVLGVLSVLAEFGALPARHRRFPSPMRWVHGGGDLDFGGQAAQHGLFVSVCEVGEEIAEGAEIGRMFGYDGDLLEVVRAPRRGVVMFLRRRARTRAGEVLFAMSEATETPL
ncbi:succinylglutamate desuccinylase/aspartoacylase family protein [Amycolatopsis deserti]|uniref:succinylglutamate desuccinylase/aspartoacylase family protein n=1 Tax=Amycolatopsis deserti TaxID=185696 RepID=UPI00174D4693|nr:succinylglutamate desuccinylase/aspartoacylase family protein [Amycolatopsis deserti]